MRRTALFGAIAALALTGCSGKEPPAGAPTGNRTSSAAPTASKVHYVIGMSQCTEDEPWRVQMDKDIKESAATHGEIELLLSVAGDKSEQQQADVRQFIQRHVNLIVISPKESRPLTAPVAEAMDAGIPVIVLDRAVEGDKFTCFIGGDNVKIGEEAGKEMVKLLGGKGDIIEIKGLMTSKPAQDRHNGFIKGIAGSQIKILSDVDCQWKQPKAQAEMNSMLSRYPKIDAVYGHNDPMAHGAYLAAKQEGKGREKQIKFIGIDALPTEGVRLVRDGVLTATFQYPTCGHEAIDTALKILNKESVPKNITLGTRIFTKENVEKGGEPL